MGRIPKGNRLTKILVIGATGSQGGAVYTVAEAHDGLFFGFDSGNIASGTFTLYGLKK